LSVLHDERHAVALAHFRPPEQADDVPPMHVPAPSHVPPFVSVPFWHEEAPQLVPLGGYTHAPVLLQSVAPHVPPVVQAAVQQRVPVPDGPHTPLVHWSVAPQTAPAAPIAKQTPPEQYVVDDWQSPSVVQVPRHAVALAHFTPPVHAVVVPLLHMPLPLHMPAVVSCPLEHEAAPHAVPEAACWHVPPAAHLPVLPHVPVTAHWPTGAVVPAVMLAHVPSAWPVSAIVHA
jgi:hypothetical protein